MQQPVDTALLALLLQAYNKEVKDFFYFPEVVLIGPQRVEPESFYGLLHAGYLELVRFDSFGRYFRLSGRAQTLLIAALAARQKSRRKKQAAAPVSPGRFRTQLLNLPSDPSSPEF